MQLATLAGGCFWCMERTFQAVTGILSMQVGYVEGTEAIEITFDSTLITFLQILDLFWTHIDPFDPDGQFADRGSQYHTKILTHNGKQMAEALASLKVVESLFHRPVAVRIEPTQKFVRADEAHQNYCMKQQVAFACYQAGHLPHLAHLWKERKKMLYQTLLEEKLTPLQFRVTRRAGTEPPFKNPYWHFDTPGLYLDIITRDPLFSSEHKYDSGTGWPSFTKSLVPLIDGPRGEVLSPYSRAHLGHVFPDGPKEAGGLRYCMNSAALFFIPKYKSEEEV